MIKQNDPRRWQERTDMRLINEDHNAMANLSPNFINKQVYHNSPVYGPGSPRYNGIESDHGMVHSFYAIVKDRR